MQKILVVDDEVKIVSLVKQYLESDGFSVETATDGLSALSMAKTFDPDLIVLDIMLPKISGLEVCRELRKSSDVPIIMLTAKSEEIDRLIGLELGADDYLTKPFSPRELVARIKTVLRRTDPKGRQVDSIFAGDLELNFSTYVATIAGKPLNLTPTEFKILGALVRSPGRVFTRLQLLDAVSGDAFEGYERSIDTHISNIRKKIETDPSNPKHILTVFGIGYKWANSTE